jgi:hypothetical protein
MLIFSFLKFLTIHWLHYFNWIKSLMSTDICFLVVLLEMIIAFMYEVDKQYSKSSNYRQGGKDD